MKASEKKALLFLLAFLSLFLVFRFSPGARFFTKENLLAFFESFAREWWAPWLFMALYGVGSLLVVPGSLFSLVGGAIFGFPRGFLYNLSGATLGASLAFLTARCFGRDWLQGHLVKKKRLEALDQKIKMSGFKTIFRLRLLPIVPFNLFNFSAGLSSVSFWDFFWGSVLGMTPGCLIYTYFAQALVSGVKGTDERAMAKLLFSSALLLALSFLPAWYRKRIKEEI